MVERLNLGNVFLDSRLATTSHDVSQAALEAFEANAIPSAAADDSDTPLTRWLEPSFQALPSDQHRQMFLDAALLMHAEPQAHLRATWIAVLQLDCAQRQMFMGYDAAVDAFSRIFDELINSSLITVATGAYDEQGARCASC